MFRLESPAAADGKAKFVEHYMVGRHPDHTVEMMTFKTAVFGSKSLDPGIWTASVANVVENGDNVADVSHCFVRILPGGMPAGAPARSCL